MSVDALKKELSALNADEQRQLTAFLVSLENARVDAFRKRHVGKSERAASDFALLEDLDRRLGLSGDKKNAN
ncbi:MAG TPA: hypothetical protein VH280_01660 [Verrucomicrobiae bacterium]|jgi:hypothetical protein|nr:hypothetical protein [Verrucomicrobiae bacterium]